MLSPSDQLNRASSVQTIADGAAPFSDRLVERSLAAKRGWLAEGQTTLKRAKGINGSGAIAQFRLPSVKLGEFESTNTLVSVAAKDQDYAMFERTRRPGSKIQRNVSKSCGLLGWDMLKDFVVTIDYRIGKIHLKPAATS